MSEQKFFMLSMWLNLILAKLSTGNSETLFFVLALVCFVVSMIAYFIEKD